MKKNKTHKTRCGKKPITTTAEFKIKSSILGSFSITKFFIFVILLPAFFLVHAFVDYPKYIKGYATFAKSEAQAVADVSKEWKALQEELTALSAELEETQTALNGTTLEQEEYNFTVLLISQKQAVLNAKIKVLQEKIDGLNPATDADAIAQNSAYLDADYVRVQGLIAEQNAIIANLNDEWATKYGTDDETTKQADIGTLEGQISDKNTTIGTLQGQITDKNTTIGTLEGQISDKNTTIGTLQGQISDKNTAIGDKTAYINNTLKPQYATIKANLDALTATLPSDLAAPLQAIYAALIADKSADVSQHITDFNTALNAYKNHDDKAIQYAGFTTACKATIANLEDDLEKMAELKDKYDEALTKIDELKDDIDKLGKAIETLEKEIADLTTEKGNNEARKTALENTDIPAAEIELAQATTDYNSAVSARDTLVSERDGYSNQITENNTVKIPEQVGNIDAADKAVSDIQKTWDDTVAIGLQKIYDLKVEISNLQAAGAPQADIDAKIAELNAAKAAIDGLDVTAYETQIQTHVSARAAAEQEKARLEAENGTLQGKIDALAPQIAAAEQDVEDKEAIKNGKAGALEVLEDELVQVEKDIAALTSTIAEKESEKSSKETAKTTAEGNLTTWQNTKSDLETQFTYGTFDQYNALVAEKNGSIETEENKIDGHLAEVTALDNSLSFGGALINLYNAKVANDQTAVDHAQASFESRLTEVDSYKTTTTGYADAYHANSKAIADLEAEIVGLETEIGTLNGQIDDLKDEITDLNDQIDDLNDEIDGLDADIAVLEGHITDMGRIRGEIAAAENLILGFNEEIAGFDAIYADILKKINGLDPTDDAEEIDAIQTEIIDIINPQLALFDNYYDLEAQITAKKAELESVNNGTVAAQIQAEIDALNQEIAAKQEELNLADPDGVDYPIIAGQLAVLYQNLENLVIKLNQANDGTTAGQIQAEHDALLEERATLVRQLPLEKVEMYDPEYVPSLAETDLCVKIDTLNNTWADKEATEALFQLHDQLCTSKASLESALLALQHAKLHIFNNDVALLQSAEDRANAVLNADAEKNGWLAGELAILNAFESDDCLSRIEYKSADSVIGTTKLLVEVLHFGSSAVMYVSLVLAIAAIALLVVGGLITILPASKAARRVYKYCGGEITCYKCRIPDKKFIIEEGAKVSVKQAPHATLLRVGTVSVTQGTGYAGVFTMENVRKPHKVKRLLEKEIEKFNLAKCGYVEAFDPIEHYPQSTYTLEEEDGVVSYTVYPSK